MHRPNSSVVRSLILTAALLAVALPAAAAPPGDFTLNSLDGKKFTLSEAKGRLVALHFLLKTECPYCIKYVREFAGTSTTLPDVINVFIKPDDEAAAKAFAAKLTDIPGGAPTVYRDENAALAKAFEIPDGYESHGDKMHFPATILLDRNGKELFRFVGKSNTDRLALAEFTAKVTEFARSPELAQYNLKSGEPAIQGYDPVSYTTGKPAKGRKEIAATFRGATYWFESDAARAKFAETPDKFAPAYGGWCATAMAEGRKVEIDPTNFKIANGRLFLFYKGWLGNALNDWNKDEPKLTRDADASWKKLAPRDATN